jgi:Cyclin
LPTTATSSRATAAQGSRPNESSSSGVRRRNRPLTAFDAIQAPSISVRKYLSRLVRFSAATTETLAVGLVYVERLCTRGLIVLTELNVHRLLITASTISAKFLNDSYYQNSYYARVGGLSCAELNRLELEFLFLIDFRLSLAEGEYCDFVSSLFALPLLRRSVGATAASSTDRHLPVGDEQETTQQLLQQLCEQASGEYSDDEESDESGEDFEVSTTSAATTTTTTTTIAPAFDATVTRHPKRRAKKRHPLPVHLAMRPSPLVVRLRAAGPNLSASQRPISDTIIACRRPSSRDAPSLTAYPDVPKLALP